MRKPDSEQTMTADALRLRNLERRFIVMPRDADRPDPTADFPSTGRKHPGAATVPIAGRVGAEIRGGSLMPVSSSTGAPPQTDGPDLGALFKALQRRWLMALGIGLLVACGVAFLVWKFLAPEWTAFTQLRISSKRPDLLDVENEGRNEFNLYLRSQASIIRTRQVLNKAILRDEVKRLNLEQRYPDPVAWLEQQLKVDFQKDNEVVKVSVSSDNPTEAKALVQAVTNAYRDGFVFKENQKQRENYLELQSKYNDQLVELRKLKGELEGLNKELGVTNNANIEFQRADQLARLNSARGELTRLQIQLLKAEGQLQAHKSLEGSVASTLPPVIIDPVTIDNDATLRKNEAEVERWEKLVEQHRSAGTTSSRGYRLVKKKLADAKAAVVERRNELQARLDSRKKQLEQQRAQQAKLAWKAQLTQLESNVNLLKIQEKTLQKQIASFSGTIAQTVKGTTQKEMLEHDIQRRQGLLNTVGHRLLLSKLALSAGERIEFPQGVALEPQNHKKQILATGMAFCACFGGVCFLIAIWEFRRKRVQSASQVSTGLGIRLLGTMPSARNAQELVTSEDVVSVEDEVFLEAMDALRTVVLHQAHVQSTKILMVTSADDGEGKTLLASHLAASLARSGRKTLLIDADLRLPGSHLVFGLAEEPGLCDILVGEADTLDTIQATAVDGLMVLPAGQCDRDVLQALARDGMQDVLARLRDEFDHIIIDSHSVLGATDALLVGQNVDAVLMTVLRDVSHMPHVQAATQRLSDVGIRLLGAVVNGLDAEEVYSSGVGYSTPVAVA